jgi:cell wall-associated NlpC family hydrolase
MVLQALYSAGLDPQPITVDKHVLPDYRTSVELYHHPRLAHVPRSAVQRGDLVFWRSNKTGRVNHVAIYLGDMNVLEAVEPHVRIGSLGNRSTQTMMPEVVRPFGAAPPAPRTVRAISGPPGFAHAPGIFFQTTASPPVGAAGAAPRNDASRLRARRPGEPTNQAPTQHRPRRLAGAPGHGETVHLLGPATAGLPQV